MLMWSLLMQACNYYLTSAGTPMNSQPFPDTWRDTPKNRERWQRLQNSNVFLYQQQARDDVLSCQYCGAGPLRIYHWNEAQGARDKATVDHVVPMSREGADHPSNMVVSCAPCKYRKGDRTLS